MSFLRVSPAHTVDDLLASQDLIDTPATCLHPDCHELCTYKGGKVGRPRLYCSDRCAKRYSATRSELLNRLQLVERAIEHSGRYNKMGYILREQLSLVRWHLARYGGEA